MRYWPTSRFRERIKTDVEEGMEKTQREFLLRRQLESIKKELGQIGSGDEGEPDDYRTKLEERPLPDAVHAAVEREIDKLERMSEQNPEHGWIRTWLDTVFELPGARSPRTAWMSPRRHGSSRRTTTG